MIGLSIDSFIDFLREIPSQYVMTDFISERNGILYSLDDQGEMEWYYSDMIPNEYSNFVTFDNRIITYMDSSIGYPKDLTMDILHERIQKHSTPVEPYQTQERVTSSGVEVCITSPLDHKISMKDILPGCPYAIERVFIHIFLKKDLHLIIENSNGVIHGHGQDTKTLYSYIKSLPDTAFLKEGTAVSYNDMIYPIPKDYKVLHLDRINRDMVQFLDRLEPDQYALLGIDGIVLSDMVLKSIGAPPSSSRMMFKVYGQYSDIKDALCLFPVRPIWKKYMRRDIDPYIQVFPIWEVSIKNTSSFIPETTSSLISKPQGLYDARIICSK